MILNYKFLKSGNSGSKVLEIHPIRGHHPDMGRFVVKFGIKTPEKKIKNEKALFRQYISDLMVQNYIAEYEETITHEAIRYNYASSDSKVDSLSFSELIGQSIAGTYDYKYTLQDVIAELFSAIHIKNGIRKLWRIIIQ